MVLRVLCRKDIFISSVNRVQYFRTSAFLKKIVQFNLSDIGEGIREVTVREWSVKVGDVVEQFDNICSVESDKASVNITSRYDGKITKLYYQAGEVALVGKPLVDIDVKDLENVPAIESNPILSKQPDTVNLVRSEYEHKVSIDREGTDQDTYYVNKALATPAVRRIAKENNVLLSSVTASGKGGRVLKQDILQFLESKSIESQDEKEKDIDTSKDHVEKIDGIRKVMVKTMTKSHAIPTFGYCEEINMTKLMEMVRDVKEIAKSKGINITFMPFFIKALSNALKQYPIFNASVDETCENIIFKSSHNIGIAMDTKDGLIVPNIKNVEKLTVSEIMFELKRLLDDGRNSKLGPSDMTGGTITISNIGIIGGTYTRPLILPPEVCIVALGKTRLTPILSENGDILKSYQMAASWTADHRIIDGASMARFNNVWKEYIENPSYLLMDL